MAAWTSGQWRKPGTRNARCSTA